MKDDHPDSQVEYDYEDWPDCLLCGASLLMHLSPLDQEVEFFCAECGYREEVPPF